MQRTLVLAVLALVASCEESKPGVTDSKTVVDSKTDSKTADGKIAVDGKTADIKGALDLPSVDRKLVVEASGDKGKVDAPAGFPCGALLSCKTATQYCEKFSGGACGGPDPSDAGVCPPNCALTTCGSAGKQVCLCQSYSCKALPTGCTSCACVGASASCSCSQFASGAINVQCTAP